MGKSRSIVLFTMQCNQVLISRQLLQEVTINVSVRGCTNILAVDVWRIKPENGIEISHQNHLALSRYAMQNMLQITPNFGSVGEELISTLGGIPGVLIYYDEIICVIQENADLKYSTI